MLAAIRAVARAVVIVLLLSTVAQAAEMFPSRPVTIVTPVAAGGPLDLTARILAEQLRIQLKQPVLVENVPGAGTLLGAQKVAQSKPDGYTLLLTTSSLSTYSAFLKDPRLDVMRDFSFVSLFGVVPYVLTASTAAPFKTLPELIAYSKANPGKLNYATYGNQNQIVTELFNQAAGITGVRVPYNGGGPAYIDIVAGRLDMMLSDTTSPRTFIEQGKLRFIAAGSIRRQPDLPDLLRPLEAERKRRIAAALTQQIMPLISDAIRPLIDTIFPLAAAADAHRRMEEGRHIGKILLSTT